MRKLFLHLIVIQTAFFVSYCAKASGSELELTTADITDVSNTLQAYQDGKISLDEITVDRNEEWGRKLLTYFVTHTNEITTKMKLPISRCYGAMGKDSEATRLAEDYVSVYSNDWHGWRIIGSANVDMKNFNVAVNAYTKALRLGDDDGSCVPLAFTAMKIDRLDIVKDILPRLIALKNSKTNRYVEQLDTVGALVLYSLRANQKGIFLKALEDVNIRDIASRDDLKFLVERGCEQFKGKNIDKIRDELKAAEADNSTTNAPSP